MVATIAAEAGMNVVVLEAGEFLTPADMSQREEEMFPKLFWQAGGRTTSDRGIKIHQGKGVGGSSVHNLNLCKRIPKIILEKWSKEEKIDALPIELWQSLYEEVETLLKVSPILPERWSPHNLLLQQGCIELGWEGRGLYHNRSGCIGSGFCEVGCAYDAKNNAVKILVPRAVEGGADILSQCQAIKLLSKKHKMKS